MQGLAGPIASQLPITPFNLVCTNVPGPQTPLYLQGHKLVHLYPYVPVGGEMAVNCAILSYNGTVYFGLSGDAQAAPDLKRLEKLLEENFTGLRNAVGIRPPQKKKGRKKSRVASIPTPTKSVPVSIPPPASFSSLETKRVPEPSPAAERPNILTQLVVA